MEKEILPINQTLLESIRDSVNRYAEVISKTLDSDVLIADNNLNIVGKTGLYFRLYSMIDLQSIIGNVLLGQKSLVIENREACEVCRRCSRYDSCQISGMMGVPIFFDGCAIGVIALVLPKQKVQSIFQNKEMIRSFLESMATILADTLRSNDRYAEEKRLGKERERVLDCLDEGVLYTDNTGAILYYNQAFAKMFGIIESIKGEQLTEVLPSRYIREYFQNRFAIRNLKVSVEHGSHQFYGFLSCREIYEYGDMKRHVFTFRSIKNIWADVNAAGYGSMVTLEWCRGWILDDAEISTAKAAAVSSQPLWIHGKCHSLNEIVAKAICNYSDRSSLGLVTVFCDNIYRELFEKFLFSRFGEVQRANHGTLLFHNVENLPIYLQERLLNVMASKEIILENGEAVSCDIRFIFTSTFDLKLLAEQGRFLEDLYYRIADNAISVDTIDVDKTRLASMLDSGLELYKTKYDNPGVYLTKEAKLKLLNRDWGQNMNEVDQILELIVRSMKGAVSEKDLDQLGFFRTEEQTVSAISDMEKEKIKRLLEAGYSKVETAKMLGIGRATLYRKMAEYQLMPSKNGKKEL